MRPSAHRYSQGRSRSRISRRYVMEARRWSTYALFGIDGGAAEDCSCERHFSRLWRRLAEIMGIQVRLTMTATHPVCLALCGRLCDCRNICRVPGRVARPTRCSCFAGSDITCAGSRSATALASPMDRGSPPEYLKTAPLTSMDTRHTDRARE